MIPFRVFDRDKKEMWVVLNHQPGDKGGSYLAARQDDDDSDGELKQIPSSELVKYRLVDFLIAESEE